MRLRILLAAAAATLTCLLSASAASAATLTVTTTNDETNQNGLCSLREAIVQANGGGVPLYSGCATGPAPYTINLAKNAVYTLTIGPALGENEGMAGDLDVTSQLKLNGNNAVLRAGPSAYNGIDRALDVQSSGNLTLNKLTVRNGQALGSANRGGAILNQGALTVKESVVAYSTAGLGRDVPHGGGIYSDPGTSTRIENSTVHDNQAGFSDGGGLDLEGTSTITKSKIVDNSAGDCGGARLFDATVTDSTISDNTAAQGGGLCFSGGTSTLTNSTVSENTAQNDDGGAARGGGVLVDSSPGPGQVTITKSTIGYNHAHNGFGGQGGGIFSRGGIVTSLVQSKVIGNSAELGGGMAGSALGMVATTVSGNSASDGGGIYVDGVDELRNSTVSGNFAGQQGGGIFVDGPSVALFNSTVTDNFALEGAGIFLQNPTATGDIPGLAAQMTIVAKQRDSGEDCTANGLFDVFHSYDIESGTSCGFDDAASGDQQNVSDAALNLGPLANNGGPTQTHALIFPSVAIDAGNNADAPPTDQRNVARPQDGNGDGIKVADIGAYERKK